MLVLKYYEDPVAVAADSERRDLVNVAIKNGYAIHTKAGMFLRPGVKIERITFQ